MLGGAPWCPLVPGSGGDEALPPRGPPALRWGFGMWPAVTVLATQVPSGPGLSWASVPLSSNPGIIWSGSRSLCLGALSWVWLSGGGCSTSLSSPNPCPSQKTSGWWAGTNIYFRETSCPLWKVWVSPARYTLVGLLVVLFVGEGPGAGCCLWPPDFWGGGW